MVSRVTSNASKKQTILIVMGIVLVSSVLKVWGTFSALPYMYNSGEPSYVVLIQKIFKTGSFNVDFFNYPSMFLYVNALAYFPYYYMEKLLGIYISTSDIRAPTYLIYGSAYANSPGIVVLGRSISILFTTMAAVVLFYASKKLTRNIWIAALSGLLLAISPTAVDASRVIKPEPFLVFWEMVAFFFAIRIYQEGRTIDYVLAGLAIGFTASSKYNGALIALCVLTAHVLRYGWRGMMDYRIFLSGICSLIGFILITPYSIINFSEFIKDVQRESNHYATGHPGMEGNVFQWYTLYLISAEGLMICVLALGQILRGVFARSKETILLSVFAVGYFVFVNLYEVRNSRTIFPVLPFLFLLGSMWLMDITNGIHKTKNIFFGEIFTSLVFVWIIVLPLWNTIQSDIQATATDSRTTARVWINKNLPAGSVIAIEWYVPYIDAHRFKIVKGSRFLSDKPIEWFAEKNVDYVVFSEGAYGRIFEEPELYPDQVAKYNLLFDTFSFIRNFNDGDYEVRVYQVK